MPTACVRRDEPPPLLEKYKICSSRPKITSQDELEEKVMRRLTQLGFAGEENGVYRFLAPMHRFLDVPAGRSRDLAAQPAQQPAALSPELVIDEAEEDIVRIEPLLRDRRRIRGRGPGPRHGRGT